MVSINIKMVGICRSYNGDIRMQSQKGAIVLIGFHYQKLIVFKQGIGVVIACNTAQESRTTHSTIRQYMSNHAGSGGFPMSSGHGNRIFSLREQTKYLRTFM